MSRPSAFFLAQRERLREAAARGPVLDLACGRGRHTLAAARLGAFTAGLDRDAARLRELARAIRAEGLPAAAARSDLETPLGIPVREGSCGALLVFRFLYRPLFPALVRALAPGGLLLYETFTLHQRDLPYGPDDPAFLLHPGELRRAFPGLEVLESWEGESAGPRPEALARLAARRPGC